MAKKNKHRKPAESIRKARPLQTTQGSVKEFNKWMLIIPLLVTFALYLPSLFNDFAHNWDDGGYILEYPVIQEISMENIQTIFTSYHKGNYHPLTTMVNMAQYAVAGDSAFFYHLVNLLLHLLNVYLVFIITKMVFRKEWIAGLVALLFGIHPMHVESVAWISELKDVLYSFFFLISLMYYLKFNSSTSKKWNLYALSLLAFSLSLLSKSAAVTLPVVLVLFDWYHRKKFTTRLILEKIPYFGLSILFGILAIFSQSAKGAIQDLTPLFNIGERLLIASYAVSAYIIKIFAPFQLSAMYPYPDRINGNLSLEFYIAPVFLLVLLALIIWFGKKHRYLYLGALFFMVTSSLTLQLLPVGGAILAERYTYIPYTGLFFIIGHIAYNASEGKSNFQKKIRQPARIILLAFLTMLFVLTFQRIKVWENGITVFSDVIEKYPNLPFAYNNRGYAYQKYREDYGLALADFNKAIQLDATYHQSYSNRGVIYHNQGKFEEALTDFEKAIKYKPDNTDALIGKANTLSTMQRFEEAIPSYDAYLHYRPDHAKAFLWRGIAMFNTKQAEKAREDFDKSLALDPNDGETYYWMALLAYQDDKVDKAVELFDRCLILNPSRSAAWSWRGLIKHNKGDMQGAISDLSRAIEINPSDHAAYVNRANSYNETGNHKAAYNDLQAAARLGYPVDPQLMEATRLAAGD